MAPRPDAAELDEVRRLALPLASEADLDPLVERLAGARHVLLGEASHGTSEYYRWRAAISKRLIEEHGFSFVAVEGDWPDCFTVNRWVKGRTQGTAREVLGQFDRWPTWMWANEEVAEFVTWLREHNAGDGDVGFYGLDVYSLWESLRVVLDHVRDHDPEALAAAEQAAACFEPYREDPQGYAWATRLVPTTCQDQVMQLLLELREASAAIAGDPESSLDAEQNAEVVAGAERYYRSMMAGDAESWNVRDHHMADTLDRLLAHHGPDARAIVWEHNTHVGDARATDMARAGMVNVGQLARERLGEDRVALVGFGGSGGSVIAADRWGATMQRFPVPGAAADTHEGVIGEAIDADAALFVFPDDRTGPWLAGRRGHRAIGVVYDPRRDEFGNWVPTVLGRRYDAFCWFAETEALHPLHAEATAYGEELETAPWGT